MCANASVLGHYSSMFMTGCRIVPSWHLSSVFMLNSSCFSSKTMSASSFLANASRRVTYCS